MDTGSYQDLGKPARESYAGAIERLTRKIYFFFQKKYSQGLVFDTLESIIKDEISSKGSFDCSRSNIGKTILSTDEVPTSRLLSLLVGPYPRYRSTSLEKFSRDISGLIYTIDMKEEIISIIFAIILKEMKLRFSTDKKYVYTGVEGVREEGIIKPK